MGEIIDVIEPWLVTKLDIYANSILGINGGSFTPSSIWSMPGLQWTMMELKIKVFISHDHLWWTQAVLFKFCSQWKSFNKKFVLVFRPFLAIPPICVLIWLFRSRTVCSGSILLAQVLYSHQCHHGSCDLLNRPADLAQAQVFNHPHCTFVVLY